MSARAEVLGRVRAALADVPWTEIPADVPVPRDYRRRDTADDRTGHFLARVADYRAGVRRSTAEDLPALIAATLDRHGARRVVVPDGLPEAWRRAVPEPAADARLTVAELDALDGVLTSCAVAVADTGTIILTGGPGQGRRALTLLPDLHLCVVRTRQVVGTVPEALEWLAAAGLATAPLTLVSGPSATSDIEMSRVEGVHGPRRLEVLLVDDDASPVSDEAPTPPAARP